MRPRAHLRQRDIAGLLVLDCRATLIDPVIDAVAPDNDLTVSRVMHGPGGSCEQEEHHHHQRYERTPAQRDLTEI
jgi:hypothetical protein